MPFTPFHLGPDLVGGLSHPLLDGIMHADVVPFAPFMSTNPLLRVLDVDLLHMGCLAAGVLGLIMLAIAEARKKAGS